MGDESVKPWKKTEDIPRRFDELPPEPGWVPVADVIRTHREDEARQEAQKQKIKPPLDSDSELSDTEAKERNSRKEGKTWAHKENEEKWKHVPSEKFDDTSLPPTVDDVTQSMVQWALSTDHYPRKAPKPLTHHKDHIKPLTGKQKPSDLLQEKSHAAMERPHGKHTSRTFMDDSRNSASPRKGHDSPPDVFRSPSGQKPQGYPSGAQRKKTQQPASNQKNQRPLYDEPSPDYDDEDYDAYYSRYDEHYYHVGEPDEDVHYYDDRGYEDRSAMDPYLYGSASHYNEYPPHDLQQAYTNPQGYSGYEYGESQYQYEGQKSGYPQPSPYYGPMPQEYPRGQHRSGYDVLY